MRKLIRISTLLLIAMLSMAGTRIHSAMAQDDGTDSGSTFEDLTQLEGLENGVSRAYTIDFETIMAEMTPEAADDFAFPEGILSLSVIVLEFDDADNAEAAYDLALEEIPASSDEDVTLEETEIDGLPDDAVAYTAVAEDESLGTTVTTAVVDQQDEYLLISFAISIGEDDASNEQLVDISNYLADEDAGDADDAEFNADGTSEGGLWDKIPAADDELVEGLIASDSVVFPVPAE